MESYSNIYEEECQSSESGWTMYLGSSIDDDDNDHDSTISNGYHSGYRQKTVAEDDDVDTDDSMASDASSGPGLQMEEKYILRKKYKKTMQQKKKVTSEKDKKEGEKEVANDKKGVVSSHQSRNSVWFRGRRK
ncbi:hypothetical protein CTI12_AA370550 [Artemisia annua]|uniref:Uncharacterized protein n=1 Tax=Artemisia annua TaxID=35608 RepID=A0A2U1MKE5_ARTAN|nr:hypothetical protein CTI12_AA370550 [Artemisia annua]